MSRVNKIYLLAIFILIISLITFLFSLYIRNNVILDEKEFYTSLMIGERAGFDLNKTAITFGKIMPGSGSNRNLMLVNSHVFPVRVELSAEGDIARFLSFERFVSVGPNETKRISLFAAASKNETYGNYTGKIIALIKKDI